MEFEYVSMSIRFQQYMIMMHILRSIAVPRLCKWIINADKFKKDFKKCHDHASQIDGRFLVLVNQKIQIPCISRYDMYCGDMHPMFATLVRVN